MVLFVLLSNANNSFAMHCYGSILFDSSLFIRVFFSSLVRWLLSFNFGFRLLWWRLFNNFVSFTIFVANFFALFPFHFLRAVFTIKGSTLMLRHANRHMNGAFLCIGMIWLNPNIWSIFIFFYFLHSFSTLSLSLLPVISNFIRISIASNGVPPTVSKRIMLSVNCKYFPEFEAHISFSLTATFNNTRKYAFMPIP